MRLVRIALMVMLPTSLAMADGGKVPLRVLRVLPDTDQALLFDRNTNKAVLAEVGEKVEGYDVREIDDDEVTLAAADGTTVLLAAPDLAWHRRPSHAAPAKAPDGPQPIDPYADAPVRAAEAPRPLEAGEGGVRVATADEAAAAPVPAPAPIAAVAAAPGTVTVTVTAPVAAAVAAPAAAAAPAAVAAPAAAAAAAAAAAPAAAAAAAPVHHTHATHSAPTHRVAVAIPAPAPAPAVSSARGVLMISTKPPCSIIIDGKPTHLVTPQRAFSAAAGNHVITFVDLQKKVRGKVAIRVDAQRTTKLIRDYTR